MRTIQDDTYKLITAFIAGPDRQREWFTNGYVTVYMRKTGHYIGDKFVPTLDIANVSVAEQHRGQSLFTQWLSRIEALALAQGLCVRVEAILEPRLIPFLEKRGYCMVPDTQDNTMFLLK